jgi:hypothetical protein
LKNPLAVFFVRNPRQVGAKLRIFIELEHGANQGKTVARIVWHFAGRPLLDL